MTRLPFGQHLRKGLSRTLRPAQFRLRRQFLLFVDLLAMLTPVKPNANRVLLVRVDHIGDLAMWLDVARTLAEHYRSEGKHVTLLGNAGWSAWAEELRIFDVVLPLEGERYKKNLRYRLRIGKRLRRGGFGVAVHAASTRVFEMGDSLVRVSGATEKIGPTSAPTRMASDRWYTRLVHTGTPEMGELRKSAAFASELLSTRYKARVADIRGMVKRDRLDWLAAVLPKEPYFVLFPGASHPGRKWPALHFVELARKIHDHTGWTGVVCGGPGDAADSAYIVKEAGSLLQNLAGQTDLGQLAAVIAGAKFVVSNETSAVHIAAAVGVPSVCILGGGHFGRFVPYDVEVADNRPLPRFAIYAMPCFGCNWTCEFHPRRGEPMPCVEGVTLDAVWQEIEGLLQDAAVPSSPFRMLPPHGNPTKDEVTPALVGI